MARRDEREYGLYSTEEQRRQPGCSVRRMQADFLHGLLGLMRQLAARGLLTPDRHPAETNQMVSQYRARRPRAERGTRDRLLAAGAEEFSARGFEGAKVDRIAARAGVNKAMLYYHFTNKAALYREILRELFVSLAAQLAAGIPAEAPPGDQIRQFVRTLAAEMARRPHFPSIWLREMAESGPHLDASILQPIGAILDILEGILRAGERRGHFRAAHPLVVQMGIVAPLLLFAASAPTRARFATVLRGGGRGLRPEAVTAHIEAATLAALEAPARPRGPAAAVDGVGVAVRPRGRTSSRRAPR
jgi:TetR/AcrR family transcriptional regulator